MSRPHVIVLTGPSRAGKTTVCQQVVAAARSRGLSVAGVMTEDGAATDGAALQIAQDLRSGERRLLATARSDSHAPPSGPTPSEPKAESGAGRLRWEFDADGVAFGRRALDDVATAGCDLLVIDQIGPLELRHGGGWTEAFDVVAAGRFALALLVVNPSILEEAEARLTVHSRDTLWVDDATREELPTAIVSAHFADHLPT